MIFNPMKKTTVTWKEYCSMKEKELDEIIEEREKRGKKREKKINERFLRR